MKIHKDLMKHIIRVEQVIFLILCVTLSPPTMAQVEFGEVVSLVPARGATSFQITPNNRTVVYMSDQDTDGQSELFAINIDGSGTATKISSPLIARGDVSSFRISPDGQTVVYLADQEQDDIRELYSAPIDGSRAAIKLNPTLVPGGNVTFNFQVSVDNTVVYRADQDVDNVDELYSVPIDGSEPAIKISPPLVEGGSVFFFLLSPDTKTVLYESDQEIDNKIEIFSIPSNGVGNSVKLNSEFGPEQGAFTPLMTPDNKTVVYFSDQDTVGTFELFSVALDGSRPIIKLNGPMTPGGSASTFRMSLDGETIVYLADQDTLDVHELYSVPTNGSRSAIKLNSSTTFIKDPSRLGRFVISPDGQTVVFPSDANNENGSAEIFSTNIGGGGPVHRVNGELTQGGNVRFFRMRISADSKTVFYVADQQTDNVFELYSVPISGADSDFANTINSSLSGFIGSDATIEVSSDGQFLIFNSGSGVGENSFRLFSVRTVPITPESESSFFVVPTINGRTVIFEL